MSNHSFDVHIATEYKSVELAVLIWHFQYWIMKNKRLKRNYKDGRTWTYQTIKEIAALFPYWSQKQVERFITKAVERKILLKANYNKSPYDRTAWYAFANEEKFGISRFREMENLESGNENAEIGSPIPNTLTNTLTNEGGEEAEPPAPPPIKKKAEETMQKFGEYVLLCPRDYETLSREMGKAMVDYYIESINNYIPNAPKKYRNYASAIRQWRLKDLSKGIQPKLGQITSSKSNTSSYTPAQNKAFCERQEQILLNLNTSNHFFNANSMSAMLVYATKDINKVYDYNGLDREELMKDLRQHFPRAFAHEVNKFNKVIGKEE